MIEPLVRPLPSLGLTYHTVWTQCGRRKNPPTSPWSPWRKVEVNMYYIKLFRLILTWLFFISMLTKKFWPHEAWTPWVASGKSLALTLTKVTNFAVTNFARITYQCTQSSLGFQRALVLFLHHQGYPSRPKDRGSLQLQHGRAASHGACDVTSCLIRIPIIWD